MPSRYAYVTPASDSDADMEMTSAACQHTYNGVGNACAYVTQIPPTGIVLFTVSSSRSYGLAVQASPSGTPTGTWSFDGDVEVTVSTATGKVTFAPWNGAASLTDEQRAKVIRARTPQQRGAAPALQHT